MTTAAEVYAAQLLTRRLGWPLWQPEPTKFGEVLIGDVGFVQNGCFYRLFNALRPADDPVNALCGVPPDFVPLQYNETALLHTVHDYLPPGPLYSSSVRHVAVGGGASSHSVGASYKFSCSSNQAAIVVLGDHATSSLVLKNNAFTAYMNAHHDAWHAFAAALGHAIAPDDIVLVSGWLKTSEWALAACTDCARAHQLTLDVQAGPLAGAQFGIKLAQDVQMSLEQRSGPSRAVQHKHKGSKVRDQCLFLRYYKIKKRPFFGKKIVAAAGSYDQKSFDDSDRLVQAEVLADIQRATRQSSFADDYKRSVEGTIEDAECWSDEYEITEEPYSVAHDPLDDLLDYILATSSAQVAAASHDDLFEVCTGEWPEDLPAYLQNMSLDVAVDDNGVGRILKTARHAHTGHRSAHAHASSHALHAPTHHPGPIAASPDTTEATSFSPEGRPSDVAAPTPSKARAEPSDTPDEISNDCRKPETTPYAACDPVALAVLQALRSTHPRPKHQHPRKPCAAASPFADLYTTLLPARRFPCASQPAPTSTAPAPAGGPDKFSARVIAAAPLAHIFFYRGCARFAARPHLAAAHLTAGLTACGVLYGRRRARARVV